MEDSFAHTIFILLEIQRLENAQTVFYFTLVYYNSEAYQQIIIYCYRKLTLSIQDDFVNRGIITVGHIYLCDILSFLVLLNNNHYLLLLNLM